MAHSASRAESNSSPQVANTAIRYPITCTKASICLRYLTSVVIWHFLGWLLLMGYRFGEELQGPRRPGSPAGSHGATAAVLSYCSYSRTKVQSLATASCLHLEGVDFITKTRMATGQPGSTSSFPNSPPAKKNPGLVPLWVQ